MKPTKRRLRRHHTARLKRRTRSMMRSIWNIPLSDITDRHVGHLYETHFVPCSCHMHRLWRKPVREKTMRPDDWDV